MFSYEDFLSHLIGIRVRKQTLKRLLRLTLLTAALITPVTFGHALVDYAQNKAATATKWVLMPAMDAIQKNLDKQMQKAQQLQKAKQLQQQKVQSSHN